MWRPAARTLLVSVYLAGAAAQETQTAGGASIQGKVTLQDSPSAAPERIAVQLSQGSGATISTVYTGGNGQFQFPNVPTGDYAVSVELRGYQRFSQAVTVHRGLGRVVVYAHLRPLPAVRKSKEAAAVSVQEMLAPAAARREYAKGLDRLRQNDGAGAERHWRKAVEEFQQALRLDENNREALLGLARVLNDLRLHVEALRAAARLEQLGPDPRNHLEIARGLLGAGKVAEAETAARQLEKEPHAQAPEVHLVLFNILQGRRETAAAAAELRAYLKEMEGRASDPATARARELLGKLEKQ